MKITFIILALLLWVIPAHADDSVSANGHISANVYDPKNVCAYDQNGQPTAGCNAITLPDCTDTITQNCILVVTVPDCTSPSQIDCIPTL